MTDHLTTDVATAAVDVAKAWRVAGPHPAVHAAAIRELRRTWPTLANAVERLSLTVEERSLPKGLHR